MAGLQHTATCLLVVVAVELLCEERARGPQPQLVERLGQVRLTKDLRRRVWLCVVHAEAAARASPRRPQGARRRGARGARGACGARRVYTYVHVCAYCVRVWRALRG